MKLEIRVRRNTYNIALWRCTRILLRFGSERGAGGV